MLSNVIDQFSQVILDLVKLTREDEKYGVANVREEVARLKMQVRPCLSTVSKAANLFCGKAIQKNFDPRTGRFAKLSHFGNAFREGGFEYIEEKESVPARHLGFLLEKGTTMDCVFEGTASTLSAFETMQGCWLQLLFDATSCSSMAATDHVWTSGLADAGLHNMFVSEQFLWLFDLGEPERIPIPAFLTKFLMSFFHTFGMEDDDYGSWVVRFVETDNDKLVLTPSTAERVPEMHKAFQYVMDRFIREVFDGDDSVRRVLLQYVVLQLISDAAFCLERWESKGGGKKKYCTSKRGQFPLEKWLWRCLWDVFIATDVLNHYKDNLPLRNYA